MEWVSRQREEENNSSRKKEGFKSSHAWKELNIIFKLEAPAIMAARDLGGGEAQGLMANVKAS